MKKTLIFLGLGALVLLGSSATEAADAQAVESLQVRFCDGEKKLDMAEVNPNEAQEICVIMKNTSGQALPVRAGFVDGVMTADGEHIACRNEDDDKNGLSKFVTFEGGEFTIGAGEEVTKRAQLTFPETFAGQSFGCFTYQIGGQELTSGALNVVLRKANVIQANVKGEVKVDLDIVPGGSAPRVNETVVSDLEREVVLKYDEGADALVAEAKLKNTGNVPLEVSSEIVASNAWGFEFTSQGKVTLLPGEEKVFTSEPIDVPFYKGGYDVKAAFDYEPVLDFVPEEPLTGGTENYQTDVFLMPWSSVIAVLVIVAAGVTGIVFWRKSKTK